MDVVWLETPLDEEFSPVRQHRADAGLGWLTASRDALPAPLDAMSLGQFEPEVWIPRSHPAARRGTVSLREMASMDLIHGPRCAGPALADQQPAADTGGNVAMSDPCRPLSPPMDIKAVQDEPRHVVAW